MPQRRIAIIDIVNNSANRRLYSRSMDVNQASIMPQVIAYWCEQDGHRVHYVCYTGQGDVQDELPLDVDLAFIGAFTRSAQFAYAISNLMHSRGVVTALGGPHARCYPEDAQQYFDYVLGFTDRQLIRDVVQDCSRHSPQGVALSAQHQPPDLPGVRERWRFIEPLLRKTPFKIVRMIGSLGCPYTCSFCIDAEVPYQPLSFEVIKEDLRFLLTKFKRPNVAWDDPNFGIRFNDYLSAIEDAVPPGRMSFLAETSLALLSERNVQRLERNGFKAMLPGIESWFDMGNKSKSGSKVGMDKVRQVAEQINMIASYIPYTQANFILGLDVDEGPEPFELTKRFIDAAPRAFPYLSLLTAFGRAAPLNIEYQRAGRVVPFPFHVLNNNTIVNVRPKHYTLPEFYDRMIDVRRHAFSWRAIARRFHTAKNSNPRWLRWVNAWRTASSERIGKTRNYVDVRRMWDDDPQFRRFWSGETSEIPRFYVDGIRGSLGPLWEWLPKGALQHDPNAYLKSEERNSVVPGRRNISAVAKQPLH